MQWTDGDAEEKVYEGKVLITNFDEGYTVNVKAHDGDEATFLCDRVFKTGVSAKVGDKCIYYAHDDNFARIGVIESWSAKEKFHIRSQDDNHCFELEGDRIHKFAYEFPGETKEFLEPIDENNKVETNPTSNEHTHINMIKHFWLK